MLFRSREDCLDALVQAICSVEHSAVALLGNGERHLFGNGYLTDPPTETALLQLPGKDAIARKLWDVRRAVPFPALTTATVRRDAFEAAGGFDPRYLYFDLFCWLELLTRYDYAVVSAGNGTARPTSHNLRAIASFPGSCNSAVSVGGSVK